MHACMQVLSFYAEKSGAAKAHAAQAKASSQDAIDEAQAARGAAPIEAAVGPPSAYSSLPPLFETAHGVLMHMHSLR